MKMDNFRTVLSAAFAVTFIVTFAWFRQDGNAQDKLTGSDLSTVQKDQIEAIVRDYIKNNPKIIGEALVALQKIEADEEIKRAQQAISSNAAQLFRSEMSYIAGNPKGDVTVVEFFDYNCGFCKRALTPLTKLLKNDSNVRVVLKEFPIFGKPSEEASRAALASIEQGKYFEFHTRLLSEPGKADKAKALRIAKAMSMDVEKLEADMKSDFVNKALEESQKLAFDLRIQGTPHYLVGDRIIQGAPEDLYDQFVAHIADIRANGCKLESC